MNYAEFKAHMASFLWRDNDAVLLNALDALTTMGEAELQRVLKVQDNQASAALVFEGIPVALPADYRTLDQLVAPGIEFAYLTPALFTQRTGSNGQPGDRYYTIIGNDLTISGAPTVANPVAATAIYYKKIPSFRITDASWVADLHLDLLTYGTLQHAGRFVRDDDRVPGWQEAYKTALADVIDEDQKQRYSHGGPLRLVMKRQVR